MINEKYDETTQTLIKFKTGEQDDRTISVRKAISNRSVSLTLCVFPDPEFQDLIDTVEDFIQDQIIHIKNGERPQFVRS